jgi:hypothetical protein
MYENPVTSLQMAERVSGSAIRDYVVIYLYIVCAIVPGA